MAINKPLISDSPFSLCCAEIISWAGCELVARQLQRSRKRVYCASICRSIRYIMKAAEAKTPAVQWGVNWHWLWKERQESVRLLVWTCVHEFIFSHLLQLQFTRARQSAAVASGRTKESRRLCSQALVGNDRESANIGHIQIILQWRFCQCRAFVHQSLPEIWMQEN